MLVWIIATAVLGAAIAYFFGLFGGSNDTPTPVVDPLSKPPTVKASSLGGVAQPSGGNDVLVLYGSQTGTAEMYAKTLHHEASNLGVPSRVQDLEDYTPENIAGEKLVVFVVATYGEGEPTDTMKEFYDWLMDQNHDENTLNGVKYTVFGLGDRQFKFFCHMGVEVDRRMAELGAQRIYGLGCGDAGKTIEEEFDAWRKELWPAIGHTMGIKLKEETEEPYKCELKLKWITTPAAPLPFPKSASALEPTQKQPGYGTIIENKELLTNAPEGMSTRRVVFDITDTLISYQAGDHLGVLPCNSKEVVDEYLKLLKIDEETAVKVMSLQDKKFKNVFAARVTVRDALTWYIDLCGVPKKSALRALAHCCTDATEREEWLSLLRVTPEATENFRKLSAKLRNVAGFLRKFKSCDAPLALFLEVMPRIAPRFFSISSDQLSSQKSIAITVALVPDGMCTPLLCSAPVGTKLPLFVRKSNFHLPLRAKNRPLIMIGPGTGVAPLIGFIHRRQVWKDKGNELGAAMLFFGCRHKAQDYLYQSLMEKALEDGILSTLEVAFSRDQAEKVYVQHKLRDRAAEVYKLLQEGANVYICGDAKHMAKDVEAELKSIIMKQGNKTKEEAEKYITTLEEKERLLKDVWSH